LRIAPTESTYDDVFERIVPMANSTAPRVSPQEIKELIERAAKEPGINDVLALSRSHADRAN
jgi:hypothetical protein